MDGLARIGGALLILGGVFTALAFAIVLAGGAVGLGGSEVNGWLVSATLVSIGLGAAALAIAGRAPVDQLGTRIGLGLVGVGPLCLALSPLAVPPETDPLESGWWVGLAAGGALVTVVGLLVTGASLVRRAGAPRMVGLVLIVSAPAWILPPIGVVMTIIGVVCVGLLGLRVVPVQEQARV
jgi:hypothetical protein